MKIIETDRHIYFWGTIVFIKERGNIVKVTNHQNEIIHYIWKWLSVQVTLFDSFQVIYQSDSDSHAVSIHEQDRYFIIKGEIKMKRNNFFSEKTYPSLHKENTEIKNVCIKWNMKKVTENEFGGSKKTVWQVSVRKTFTKKT